MGVDLMAQHALLRKNLHVLQRDVDQQKDDIKKLKDKESRLTDTIKSLEKDIQGHKKEIREREETVSDKEKRIFDLKKKNQELEKFRFVLDYKIKELKLQIAPRESEIATMRKQVRELNPCLTIAIYSLLFRCFVMHHFIVSFIFLFLYCLYG